MVSNVADLLPAHGLTDGAKNANYQKKRSQSKADHYEPLGDFNLAQNQAHIMQNLQKMKFTT